MKPNGADGGRFFEGKCSIPKSLSLAVDAVGEPFSANGYRLAFHLISFADCVLSQEQEQDQKNTVRFEEKDTEGGATPLLAETSEGQEEGEELPQRELPPTAEEVASA